MRRMLLALVALSATAAAMTSAAGAQHGVARQPLTITAKNGVDGFVLLPRAAGAVTRDKGTGSWCCWSQRFVTRNGQQIEVNDPTLTLTGDHGTLVLKITVEWVDAGNGYTIGTGLWKVVRGTGEYANLTGGGRGAHLWIGQSPRSWRLEGYLVPK
jgi:hypothetical protein